MAVGSRQALGIDLGASKVRVALGDNTGRIFQKILEPLHPGRAGERITDQILRMISSLKVDYGKLAGIGIGSIGPLDMAGGGVMKGVNVARRSFLPLVEPIQKRLHIKPTLLNDCVAAVVAERAFGAGKNIDNLAYVTISTGIGCGVYVDGHLLLGKDGNAHEVGHIVVDFEGKLRCGCGRMGHWEAYCSGKNLPRYVRHLLKHEKKDFPESSLLKFKGVTAKDIFNEAKRGDSLALEILDRIGRINAAGLASIVNVYDPSLVTIGGSVALNNPDLILKPMLKHLNKYIMNRKPKFMITPLGEDAVLLGAIAYALQ